MIAQIVQLNTMMFFPRVTNICLLKMNLDSGVRKDG